MKKIFILFMVVILLMGSASVFAEYSYDGVDDVFTETLDINDLEPNNQYQYEYKTVYVPENTHVVRRLVPGQSSGGVAFIGTSGSVNISTNSSNGNMSYSVYIGLPGVQYATVSANFGLKVDGATGYSVYIPGDGNYYHVYNDKTVTTKGYVVYRRNKHLGGDWEVYTKVIYDEHVNDAFFIKRV